MEINVGDCFQSRYRSEASPKPTIIVVKGIIAGIDHTKYSIAVVGENINRHWNFDDFHGWIKLPEMATVLYG
jgi:hypothetical protein